MVPDIPTQENYEKLKTQLRKKRILESLSNQQIEQFASYATYEEHKQGEIIIRQGATDKAFYYVLSGQVRVIDESKTPPRLINYMGEGDFFGERALLYNAPRAATVDVAVDVILAKFEPHVWRWLLDIDTKLADDFHLLEETYEENAVTPFPGRQADEVAIVKTKRHILAFIITLVGPLMVILLALIVGLAVNDLGLFDISFNTVITAGIVILCLLWSLYNFAEWYNDDFIISTKRVIHIERDILGGEHREEAPLVQVLDANFDSPNFFARVFDYSHVTIKSYGLGTIKFDGIKNGQKIIAVIFKQIDLAKERVKAEDLASIRKQLASQIGYEGTLEASQITPVEVEQKKKRFNFKLPRIVRYYLPIVKEESAEQVIWRKHFLVWLKHVWLPGLFVIGSLVMLVGTLIGSFGFSYWFTGLAFGISLFWYTYMHDDWHRDRYIVTKTKIIHQDSTAFRLRGETYRETVFANVQNIDYISPTFLARILNMGDVLITTAAVAERFKFNDVYYPRDVQQEIFKRWVDFNEDLRKEQRANEENRFSTWLGEYNRMLQLREQHKRESEE